MWDLPTSAAVGGKEYHIRNNADYRVILDVIAAYEDETLTDAERVISALIIFYDGVNTIEDVYCTFDDVQEAVNVMMRFISCDDNKMGHNAKIKLIDWVQDEQLIASAINRVIGQEVRFIDYMHWWTFIGHYMAVGECALSHVVGIRNKIARGKKLEKHEKEFRRNNPQYFVWERDIEKQRNNLQQFLADGWE